MKKYVILVVLFAATLMIFLDFGLKKDYANTSELFKDDFSTLDASKWTLIGSPKPTITTINNNKSMQLTPNKPNQVGTIWLKQPAQPILPPYIVTFKFQINGKTNAGADGIVFMFNKKQNTSPVVGKGMDFEVGTGYGVEFDTYINEFDPNGPHISNAVGTEVFLVLKDAVDPTSLSASKFVFAGSDIKVTSIQLESGDTDHPTIHLILSRPILLDDVMLLNVTGVKSITSEIAFPIKTLASLQELIQKLDLENDGVHMNDIIHYMQTQQDITGDNLFDSDDIRLLLQQV